MLKKIFSVTNEYKDFDSVHKVLTIFGIKIKFKYICNQKKIEKDKLERDFILKQIKELSQETKLLRAIVQNSIDITKIPSAKGNFRTVQLIKLQVLEIVDFLLTKNQIKYWLDYGSLIGAIRHNGFIPWDDDIDLSLMWEDYLKLPLILKSLTAIDENFQITYGWNNEEELLKISYGPRGMGVDFFPMEYINKRNATQEKKHEFEKKWTKINDDMIEKFSKQKFINHKKHHLDKDVIQLVSELKNETFKNYKADINSGQMILSPEVILPNHHVPFAIHETSNIFPLKKCKFEHLDLPIPLDPIEYLYETHMYGAKGAVMDFPSFKDHGFEHTQSIYDNTAEYYENILTNLVEITKKIKEQ